MTSTARFLAAALSTALLSCGTETTLAEKNAASRPFATAPPLERACAEFKRLRGAAHGGDDPVATLQLHPDRARELFHRAEALGFSGGFLLSRRGEVLVAEGYGLANRSEGIRITPRTSFDIGSVTKQFTAAAVLRLEELGLLRVDDTIARHLSNVPADKSGITLHHLLTHSAGFEHDVGKVESLPTCDEAVRRILQSTLRSVPGVEYSYSNAGYVLLAAIIDRVSGKGYERFLREEFWGPLGMARTGMALQDRRGLELAEGFTFAGPVPATRADTEDKDGASWLVRGAGHISSTLEDLHRWTEALRTGAVLSEASRTKLFRPHVRENVNGVSYYAYGWAVTSAPDGSCQVTHDGSSGIHHDFISFLPEHDAVLIAFNTQRRTPWSAFLEQVTPVLTGASDIDLPAVARVTSEPPESLAGEYRFSGGQALRVVVRDGRLTIPSKDKDVLRLFSPWPAADAATVAPFGDRAALVATVMDAISRGDYAPLKARLPARIPIAEEEAFWREYWPRWEREMGPYRGSDFIETVNVEGSLRSLALIRFERSATVVGFVHSKDSEVFVDTMAQWFLPEVALVPIGGSDFVSYHPRTHRTIRVAFDGSSNPRALRIGEGSDALVARRTDPR